MKLKYILPVATIASVAAAVAPIATSCSCSTAIKLKFSENAYQDDPCFFTENFSAEANKTYKFSIDFSEASEDAIRQWGDDRLGFGAQTIIEEVEKFFAPIKEKTTILVNNEDVTSMVEITEKGTVRIPKTLSGSWNWTATDKIAITIAWPESFENVSIFVGKFK